MFIPVPVLPSLPSFPSVFKKLGPGADHWLVSIIDRHAGGPCGSHRWFMVAQRKVKLPNEPNLKTAPPAIPASREGQPDERCKHVIMNIFRANEKPLSASKTTLKRQKIRSKIVQNACKKHVKNTSKNGHFRVQRDGR
jgi:hypothetical protein